MGILKTSQTAIAPAIPFRANSTDRWNAVAAAVLVVFVAMVALVELALHAARI